MAYPLRKKLCTEKDITTKTMDSEDLSLKEQFLSIIDANQGILEKQGKLLNEALKLAEGMNKPIVVKLLSSKGTIPVKATRYSAGFDIFASEDKILDNNGKYCPISTDIVLKIPTTHYGKISSRSGLAIKHQIFAFHGTIDPDYQKELMVLLKNDSDAPYQVLTGDRIAQIIFIKIHDDKELWITTDLCESSRSGFGSTGK